MFRKIPFSVILHLDIFDGLMQGGFWVIAKITFANLCKLIHDVIIIAVSSGPLNLKFEYLENAKSFLDETKIIFYDFWNAFFW